MNIDYLFLSFFLYFFILRILFFFIQANHMSHQTHIHAIYYTF